MFILLLLFVLLDIFNNSATLKNIRWLLVVCISLLVIGFMFKILHWKGANIAMLAGHVSIVLLYLVQLTLRNFRPVLEIAKTIFISLLAATSLVKILHWGYDVELTVLTLGAFVIYFGMLATKFFMERKQNSIPPAGNGNNL